MLIKMTFKHIDLHITHVDSSSFRDQLSIDIEIWGGAIYRGGGEPWWEGILAFIIKEFHQVKAITIIVIRTYYCDLFKSFPLGENVIPPMLMTYLRAFLWWECHSTNA